MHGEAMRKRVIGRILGMGEGANHQAQEGK